MSVEKSGWTFEEKIGFNNLKLFFTLSNYNLCSTFYIIRYKVKNDLHIRYKEKNHSPCQEKVKKKNAARNEKNIFFRDFLLLANRLKIQDEKFLYAYHFFKIMNSIKVSTNLLCEDQRIKVILLESYICAS